MKDLIDLGLKYHMNSQTWIEEAEICFAWVISPRKERKFTIKMRQNIKIGAGMTSHSDSESIKHRNSQSQTMTLSTQTNDLTIGWQNLNLLSQPNATLAPQPRQARASGENLNYMTLAPQTRPSGEILNYLLSH